MLTRVDRPWFQLLKLKCDEPISDFAFNFSLRRYDMARDMARRLRPRGAPGPGTDMDRSGSYTRPLLNSK
jgi:hypothetical protein